ncbi:MAG: Uma2 family endonuclease [Bacteroidota bacterium]
MVRPEFCWTTERYEQAIQADVFNKEDKIELLYGQIVAFHPKGAPHDECVTTIAEFFYDRLDENYQIRQEKSLLVTKTHSHPEPDILIVNHQSYAHRRPTPEDSFLVAEVANSSLDRDRTVKVALYAEAGLQEYWIVNLIHRQIEVHLQPDTEQRIYGSVTIYKSGRTFESPFAGKVVVDDLLPKEV